MISVALSQFVHYDPITNPVIFTWTCVNVLLAKVTANLITLVPGAGADGDTAVNL